MKKKTTLKMFLIFREMELSRSKFKKLLIFQKETCKVWKDKKTFILLFKYKHKRKKFHTLFFTKKQNFLNQNIACTHIRVRKRPFHFCSIVHYSKQAKTSFGIRVWKKFKKIIFLKNENCIFSFFKFWNMDLNFFFFFWNTNFSFNLSFN